MGIKKGLFFIFCSIISIFVFSCSIFAFEDRFLNYGNKFAFENNTKLNDKEILVVDFKLEDEIADSMFKNIFHVYLNRALDSSIPFEDIKALVTDKVLTKLKEKDPNISKYFVFVVEKKDLVQSNSPYNEFFKNNFFTISTAIKNALSVVFNRTCKYLEDIFLFGSPSKKEAIFEKIKKIVEDKEIFKYYNLEKDIKEKYSKYSLKDFEEAILKAKNSNSWKNCRFKRFKFSDDGSVLEESNGFEKKTSVLCADLCAENVLFVLNEQIIMACQMLFNELFLNCVKEKLEFSNLGSNVYCWFKRINVENKQGYDRPIFTYFFDGKNEFFNEGLKGKGYSDEKYSEDFEEKWLENNNKVKEILYSALQKIKNVVRNMNANDLEILKDHIGLYRKNPEFLSGKVNIDNINIELFKLYVKALNFQEYSFFIPIKFSQESLNKSKESFKTEENFERTSSDSFDESYVCDDGAELFEASDVLKKIPKKDWF